MSAPPRPQLGPITAEGRALAEAQAALGPAPVHRSAPARNRAAAAQAVRVAIRLRESGQLAQSLPHLQRAAALDPADARIQLDLGTTLLGCHRAAEALPPLDRAIRIEPGLALAHLHFGLALQLLGREAEALGALQRAVALAPKLSQAQYHLGVLLQGWRMTVPAAAAFRAAAASAADPATARRAAASALRVMGRTEDAAAALRRAVALDPADLESREVLGALCVEQGRFDEAETHLRQVLAADPGRPLAGLELLTFRRASEAERPLLASLAARLEQPALSAQERMLLHFALGRAHDQLGEFAAAIGHFDAANAIRAGIAPLDRAALTRQVDQLIAAFPPGAPGGAPGSADNDERAVFIVGLPRSGTTLVEQVLSSHSAVAAGGEIGFWTELGPGALAAGAAADAPGPLVPLAARYRALLDGIDRGAARVTDKNPFNFSWLGLLRLALPGARIVHVRRQPLDTMVSIYTTYLSSRRTFFMGNRDDLLFWHDAYVRLMQHWRAALPAERFLEIDYEALVLDREAETRRLVAFCGLAWDEACLRPEANPRTITTASLWQARQPVYRGAIGRWRNYAPWLGPLLRLAPPA